MNTELLKKTISAEIIRTREYTEYLESCVLPKLTDTDTDAMAYIHLHHYNNGFKTALETVLGMIVAMETVDNLGKPNEDKPE